LGHLGKAVSLDSNQRYIDGPEVRRGISDYRGMGNQFSVSGDELEAVSPDGLKVSTAAEEGYLVFAPTRVTMR
jgi:hypothetical protein